MGCSDDGRAAYEYGREATELKKRLDERTAMLCGVLDLLETSEEPVQIDHLGEDVQLWWKQHKAADKKRLAAEAAERKRLQKEADDRAEGLAKLTPAQRKALGLK